MSTSEDISTSPVARTSVAFTAFLKRRKFPPASALARVSVATSSTNGSAEVPIAAPACNVTLAPDTFKTLPIRRIFPNPPAVRVTTSGAVTLATIRSPTVVTSTSLPAPFAVAVSELIAPESAMKMPPALAVAVRLTRLVLILFAELPIEVPAFKVTAPPVKAGEAESSIKVLAVMLTTPVPASTPLSTTLPPVLEKLKSIPGEVRESLSRTPGCTKATVPPVNEISNAPFLVSIASAVSAAALVT